MKPQSNEDASTARLKFITMYVVSIFMVFIILSSFWQPVPEINDHFLQSSSRQPAKPVNPILQHLTEKNIQKTDSLQKIITVYEGKIHMLDSSAVAQKNLIDKLRKNLNANIAKEKPGVNTLEVTNLKKQIKFFDWALRSQVVVTNTLTKENDRLKATIAQMDKQAH